MQLRFIKEWTHTSSLFPQFSGGGGSGGWSPSSSSLLLPLRRHNNHPSRRRRRHHLQRNEEGHGAYAAVTFSPSAASSRYRSASWIFCTLSCSSRSESP